MRLFQILTRCVSSGKMKVTRKLIDRVSRETGGNPSTRTPKPRRRKHGGSMLSFCAALVAMLILLAWLVTARAATVAPAGVSASATSGYSAAGLFNQANAFARAGKPGLAILNYERARLLAPNDVEIAANLHFVRAKAGLPDLRENWLSRGLLYARPDTLAWLGSFGLALVGMSLFLVRLLPQRRLAIRSLACVGVFLIATAIGSAITLWPRVHEAIVISRGAPARISPASAAEPAFKLVEGEAVAVRAEYPDFVLVQTSAGRSGWVARADLAMVVPQCGNRSLPGNRT